MGKTLTPAEVANMKPYERQQGGWWEHGTDPYGADKVWRPMPTQGTCNCLQAWGSVTGRVCPTHGHIAPLRVTC